MSAFVHLADAETGIWALGGSRRTTGAKIVQRCPCFAPLVLATVGLTERSRISDRRPWHGLLLTAWSSIDLLQDAAHHLLVRSIRNWVDRRDQKFLVAAFLRRGTAGPAVPHRRALEAWPLSDCFHYPRKRRLPLLKSGSRGMTHLTVQTLLLWILVFASCRATAAYIIVGLSSTGAGTRRTFRQPPAMHEHAPVIAE